jgi:hypothetical protein
MVLHPQWRPELYLEGNITRQDTLRDHAGPKSSHEPLDRLASGYELEIVRTHCDLEIAQAQLEGYRSRQGQAFQHETYLRELTELRDGLRAGLAGTGEGVAEIAEKVKALRAGQVVEAAPERTARKVVGEEPVVSKIRRRVEPEAEGWKERVEPEPRQAGRG